MCGTRPAIETIGDAVEVILAEDREVSTLWADTGVAGRWCSRRCHAATGVRVAEADPHTGSSDELLVARHFLALIAREALSWRRGDEVELGREAR